jgi:hypothetical protein
MESRLSAAAYRVVRCGLDRSAAGVVGRHHGLRGAGHAAAGVAERAAGWARRGQIRAGAVLLVDGVARSILMGWLLLAGRDGHYPIAVVLIAGAAAGASVPFGYAAARTLLPRMVDGAIRERRRHRW